MNLFKNPFLSLFLAVYMIIFFTAPGTSAMISSSFRDGSINSEQTVKEDMQKIQRMLENKIVAGKLKSGGLTDDEINTKLKNASDNQIHILAQASDKVLAGGDILYILLIILVVVLIIKLI